MTEDDGGRLLVVDDNETNRDMLSRRLQRKGYSVEVSDIDGMEVLTRLRETHSQTDLPVIMATAKDESSRARRHSGRWEYGIYEERHPESGEIFGRERMTGVLAEGRSDSLEQGVTSLVDAVVEWRGDPHLSDDATIVACAIRS